MNKLHAFSSFSVNDIDAAQKFYAETLGLNVTEMEIMEGYKHLIIEITDGVTVMVYPKPDHQPATYTMLYLVVSEIEQAVSELKAKGVAFESYDSEYLKTDENNISASEEQKIAWFKDPAGNFIALLEELDA